MHFHVFFLQIPNWFHYACFWKRAKVVTHGDIHGFDALRWEDQEKIKEKVGGIHILYICKKENETQVIGIPAILLYASVNELIKLRYVSEHFEVLVIFNFLTKCKSFTQSPNEHKIAFMLFLCKNLLSLCEFLDLLFKVLIS